MNNNLFVWIDGTDNVMLDDFDPNEDDSEGEVLHNNSKSSNEYVANERESEMSCFDESNKNDFYEYNKGKDNIIKWCTGPPPRSIKTSQWYIVIHLLGVKSVTKNVKTIIIHSWEKPQYLFTKNHYLYQYILGKNS